MKVFLRALVTNENLTGSDSLGFWKGAHFLQLQQAGNSQRDMLELFDAELQKSLGLSVEACGKEPHTYVYLDDAVFSGGRVKSDLKRWIAGEAPSEAKVVVLAMAVHALGEYFAKRDIKEAADAAGKNIEVEFWRSVTVENRKYYASQSDVLWPREIPPQAQPYMDAIGGDAALRTGNSIGSLELFSSPEARALIEQKFLKAGLAVRAPTGSAARNTPSTTAPETATLLHPSQKDRPVGGMRISYLLPRPTAGLDAIPLIVVTAKVPLIGSRL